MRSPTQGLLAFSTILSVCAAGILQLSPQFSFWSAVVGACVLCLISMSNHSTAERTLGGGDAVLGSLVVSSLLNASMTSAAALLAGYVIGWAWGV
jgi:hypothetical protein